MTIKKYHLLTAHENWADEHDVPCIKLFDEIEYQEWRKTKIYPSAYLGNNGDSWLEEMKGKTGAEFIKEGIVKHNIVDEAFKKVYKLADLARLNLGNLFNLDQYGDDDDELDDEEGLDDWDND